MKTAGGPKGLGVQEAVSQRAYLLSQKLRGAVVQENVVCQLAFSGQWQLLDQALAGEFRGNATLLQPPQLRGGVCGHADREIKPILQALFEEQRHLHDHRPAGFPGEKLTPTFQQPGMQQVLQPSQRVGVGKDLHRYEIAAHRAIRPYGFPAELRADCGDDIRSGQKLAADDVVRIDAFEPFGGEQGGGR